MTFRDSRSRTAGLSAAVVLLVAARAASASGFASGPKLVGTGAVGNANQGSSVALSSDGSTALIGGLGDDSNAGAAWVFVRSEGLWKQQGGKLVGSGSADFRTLGVAAALSADGSTALVGGNGSGAWVFTRTAGVWSQQGDTLVAEGALGQGSSVALSADGSTALVGAPGTNTSAGATLVYTRSGGTWTQQGPALVGTNGIGLMEQGTSVALSSDGNTALVGAEADNDGAGAAWVFTRSGSVWSEQSKLVGTGAVNPAYQGSSVSLSSDGSTAIVGSRNDQGGTGAAWVFTRNGNLWQQQGDKLVGNDAVVGAVLQGRAVALSGDGNVALLGGPWDDSHAGATWVFTRTAGVWTQQGEKLVGTAAASPFGVQQGNSVALSTDGATMLVGGSGDNSFYGAAWVFMRPCRSGDANGDGALDVSDVFYLINFLFAGGQQPPACF
jgi:hypothetical protein